MRHLLTTILIIGIFYSAALAAGYKDITSKEANSMMGKGTPVFLLDVRTPEEYRKAHLKGATLIPISQLEQRISEVPRDRKIVIYCTVGSRSVAASRLLDAKGYREIYNMSDGIMGWHRSGFPLAP
jgi:rhodanese-related sulfurtransferase